MSSFFDIRFGMVMIAFFFWMYRARRALRTLRLAPAIHPVRQQPVERVSVIIPAKNEEDNIAACVEGFVNQSHTNLEIIVANDNSSDKTEEILKSYGDKIRYLNVPPTPEGWTGKNFAMHNAVGHASGNWFLFTDADTRHGPESVAAALTYARSNEIRFLTLLPKCLADSFWEHLLQPLAMGYLGLWFPLEEINNPEKPVYFANGQYILIERELYQRIKGWKAVKNEILEDFSMMERVKSQGYKAQCALGMEVFGTRMYDSLARIWRGWRKIYLYAFKRNPIELVGRFLSLICFSVIPFVGFLILLPMALRHPHEHGLVLGVLATLLGFILGISWTTGGIMKADRRYLLLHPLGCLFLAMILLDACWMAVSGKDPAWR